MRNAAVQCRGVVIEPADVRLAMGVIGQPQVLPNSETTISPPAPLKKIREEALAAVERKAIADAIRYTNGNKAAAARLLEVDVKTLYTKLRQYDLDS
jgi:DNA-binding NtrC family response regulator